MGVIDIQEIQHHMEEALKIDPRMILAFKSKLVTDEMWEYAVAMEPRLFPFCKRPSYRITSVAISTDGLNIGEVDPLNFTGEQYSTLCAMAVQQNPKALTLVPKEFRTEEMVSYACANDSELLMSEGKLTSEMVLAMLEHNPGLIQHVANPTDQMVIKALSKDPRVIVYFNEVSDVVRDWYEEHCPQYASMLLHS